MAKKRNMTAKLFNRLVVKNTPEDFLVEHWTWLRSHSFLAPLLNAQQKGDITAEACINACKEVLLVHSIRGQINDAEESLKKALTKSLATKADNSAYTITIYTKFFNEKTNQWDVKIGVVQKKRIVAGDDGKSLTLIEEEDMVYGAPMFQVGQRICARKLAFREDAVFGEIKNNYGPLLISKMTRDEGLAMVFPKEKSMATKRTSSGLSKPFKNFPRTRNTHVVGPWDNKY